MMKSARGFTLVELLIAISVLAMVAVLGWRGLDSIVRARVALNADLDQTRGLQLAFAQMQSDASNIATTDSIGNRPILDVRSGRVTLVRMVFADNQPSRVQVVAYRLQDGVLSRRESIATRDLTQLDAAWNATLGDTDASPLVVLQSGVNALTVRSWADDNAGWRSTSEGLSGTSTASTTQTRTTGQPVKTTGLEVTLTLRDRPAPMVKIFLMGAV
jgi:general secretion pathway protein J